MSQKDCVRECLKYYLMLKTIYPENKQLDQLQQIENAKKDSIEDKFNKNLQLVKDDGKQDELVKRINEICTEKPKKIEELKNINETVKKCYSMFLSLCTDFEEYKQIVNKRFKEKEFNDIKIDDILQKEFFMQKQSVVYTLFKERMGELEKENEKEKHLKDLKELIKKYYENPQIKPIKEKPIIVKVSFREFFNGFRKRVVVQKDGKRTMFVIVRKPCEINETFKINDQEFKIEIEPSNWKFDKITTENGEEKTYMKYYYSEAERNSKAITLPSGKVIVLTSISDELELKGKGYGKNGGYGCITFYEKKK